MSIVAVEKTDGVTVLTLNDPRRRNILSAEMVEAFIASVKAAENDEACRVIVITGTAPAFCAGAELSDLVSAQGGDASAVRTVYDGFLCMANCRLPTIAAVNGPAIGAGMNLALACDIRIAGRSAVFDTRFLKLGLHPGGGCGWMLLRAVGWQQASRLLFFGESLDGAQAVQSGLAMSCVDDEKLVSEVEAFALRAATAPRELLVRIKRTLARSGQFTSHIDAVDHEAEEQLWSLQQPAFASLVDAMQQKISGR